METENELRTSLNTKAIVVTCIIFILIALGLGDWYYKNTNDKKAYGLLLNEAHASFVGGDYADVVVKTDKAIAILPTDVDAYELKVRALLALGNIQDADDTVTIGLKAVKEDPKLFALQGDILCDKGKYGDAVNAYKTVLRLGTDTPITYMRLAKAYNGEGNHAEALSAIDTYFETEGEDKTVDDVDAWIARAQALSGTKQCNQAMAAAYHAALRLKDGDVRYKVADGIYQENLTSVDCRDR